MVVLSPRAAMISRLFRLLFLGLFLEVQGITMRLPGTFRQFIDLFFQFDHPQFAAHGGMVEALQIKPLSAIRPLSIHPPPAPADAPVPPSWSSFSDSSMLGPLSIDLTPLSRLFLSVIPLHAALLPDTRRGRKVHVSQAPEGSNSPCAFRNPTRRVRPLASIGVHSRLNFPNAVAVRPPCEFRMGSRTTEWERTRPPSLTIPRECARRH
jgi:hypothetical protein